MYKYETHMHTSEGSRCASSSAAEMIRKYKEEEYDGVFVTDHFFNGNTTIDRNLPWDKCVDEYCRSYEIAKNEGEKIGLSVFFAIEYGNGAADFLTYGIDSAWLKDNKCIMQMDIPEYIRFVQSSGGMVIHAHPFREAPYIDRLQLFPLQTDGIEAVNASHRDKRFNERAKLYAQMYDLPVTAGSDSHSITDKWYGGGILTEEKITCPQDYIRIVKERRISCLLEGNIP